MKKLLNGCLTMLMLGIGMMSAEALGEFECDAVKFKVSEEVGHAFTLSIGSKSMTVQPGSDIRYTEGGKAIPKDRKFRLKLTEGTANKLGTDIYESDLGAMGRNIDFRAKQGGDVIRVNVSAGAGKCENASDGTHYYDLVVKRPIGG